ncbi:MAG: 3-mercaptopyruvate sulfurtransferase [Hyphomicrobiales bacterium]
MTDKRSCCFVTTEWLAAHLDAPDVVVVDASWYLEVTKRDGHAEYLEEHIPGAIYFDIDDVADANTTLPHMLPRPEVFSSKMRKLGIGDGQKIIVYDGNGLVSAPRVWWTFKTMGATDVAILEGGLLKWDDDQDNLEAGEVMRAERHFTSRFNAGAVADVDDVRKALETGSWQVVDTRSEGRFLGEKPEPREGVPSGHMPGALNVPFTDLVTPMGCLRPDEELRAALDKAGVDLSRPIICSCGSGVTAAVLMLALAVLGHRDNVLYDGSWTEWVREGGEIVTGA